MNDVEQIFSQWSGPAKVTIEVGDHKVFIEGHISPLSFTRSDNEWIWEDNSPILTKSTYSLKIDADKMQWQRFKWTIPTKNKARIEYPNEGL